MTSPTPDEICERLRAVKHELVPSMPGYAPLYLNPDGPEAADLIQQQLATIERLSAENERLRESLRLKIAALGKE